jgi:hypothetical protein
VCSATKAVVCALGGTQAQPHIWWLTQQDTIAATLSPELVPTAEMQACNNRIRENGETLVLGAAGECSKRCPGKPFQPQHTPHHHIMHTFIHHFGLSHITHSKSDAQACCTPWVDAHVHTTYRGEAGLLPSLVTLCSLRCAVGGRARLGGEAAV